MGSDSLRFDALLRVRSPIEAQSQARACEDMGLRGMWFPEKDHDPYLLVALASGATRVATLGTAVALAFNRSPMSIAYTSWDLQMASEGRFVLGLGTQVLMAVEIRDFLAMGADLSRRLPRAICG